MSEFIQHLRDNVEKAVDYGENLKNDGVYKGLENTMQDLQENDGFSPEEALEYAWEKRKFLLRDCIEVVLSKINSI